MLLCSIPTIVSSPLFDAAGRGAVGRRDVNNFSVL